jgi:hypothetical protein
MRVAPETAQKVRVLAAFKQSEPSTVIADAVDLLIRERFGEEGAAHLEHLTELAAQN